MAGLYAPLPTLRRRPRGRLRTARGRWGVLLLPRSGLAPPTPCRSPGALVPIIRYLDSLTYRVKANCDADHYYMLNNTNPGFLPNGQIDTAGIGTGGSIPPSSVRTIGDALNDKNISWAYYGGAYNADVNLANGSTDPTDAVGK